MFCTGTHNESGRSRGGLSSAKPGTNEGLSILYGAQGTSSRCTVQVAGHDAFLG